MHACTHTHSKTEGQWWQAEGLHRGRAFCLVFLLVVVKVLIGLLSSHQSEAGTNALMQITTEQSFAKLFALNLWHREFSSIKCKRFSDQLKCWEKSVGKRGDYQLLELFTKEVEILHLSKVVGVRCIKQQGQVISMVRDGQEEVVGVVSYFGRYMEVRLSWPDGRASPHDLRLVSCGSTHQVHNSIVWPLWYHQ